jgi:tetraacyldisaccharide 4'-kinase
MKFSIQKKLSKPVISIGNITWGGTGKTPIVIELLNFLVNNNLKPVVLTRGYFRKNSKIPLILKNGAKLVNVSNSGDEPLLIAKSVVKAAVIVGKKRYKNALRFENELLPDVYILDDGFQHWNIKKNLDIVCLNAANPFGNGLLIPAGNLREKLTALKRASVIILTNSDIISIKKLRKLEQKVFSLSGKIPFITYYGEFKYKTIDLSSDFDINHFKQFNIYSLSAIGFADGFKNSIRNSGIKIKDSIILRDHSYYDNTIIKNIIKEKGENSRFIITAKDSVKFENVDDNIKQKFAVLTVKPCFMERKKEWDLTILKSLQSF